MTLNSTSHSDASIELVMGPSKTPGQFNLFTAEVEPIPGMGEMEPQPETP
jgi:hypothetical protein